MRRLFFSLYVAVAAAFVGSALIFYLLWDNGLRNELMRSGEQVALGPHYLFEQELRDVPVEQWPARIESLKPQFGHELAVLRLGDVQASPRNLRRLQRGLPALSEDDDIDYMLLPLRGSDYVVRVYISQQREENARRGIVGFYYLLEQQLARLPLGERANVLQEIERRLGYVVRSMPLSGIADEHDRRRLLSGGIVVRDLDRPEERYFKRIEGEDRVLQIGPFPRYFLERAINYLLYGVLALVVAIALYLWARPLWRDMLALDQGAVAIGMGRLDARVDVPPRSPVRALADSFNSMARRVQALLQAQKEMADAISHELWTPISRLRFGVEMLERATAPGDRKRYMQGILRDIDELDMLVEESLTYSRLASTTPHLAVERVALADWLSEVIQDVQRSSGEKSLRSAVHPADAVAHFDAKLMSRALKNVARNALRHARSSVAIEIRQDAQHTDIIVEDDGPGIPPDQRAAVFEPFYRIDSSRQRESGGHGLGLAIVKRICDWNRAEVSVGESALGGALLRFRWASGEHEPGVYVTGGADMVKVERTL